MSVQFVGWYVGCDTGQQSSLKTFFSQTVNQCLKKQKNFLTLLVHGILFPTRWKIHKGFSCLFFIVKLMFYYYMVCECVCVCVRERERERMCTVLEKKKTNMMQDKGHNSNTNAEIDLPLKYVQTSHKNCKMLALFLFLIFWIYKNYKMLGVCFCF